MKTHMLARVVVTLCLVSACASAQTPPASPLQPPSVTQGTDTNPVVIRTQRSQQEIEEDRRDRSDQRLNRWLTIGLGALTLVVLVIQLRIMKQQRIAADTQAKATTDALTETRNSNATAGRSADEMCRIAEALIASADTVKETLMISREMADTQKRAFALHRPVLISKAWTFSIDQGWLVGWCELFNTSNVAARLVEQDLSYQVGPWRMTQTPPIRFGGSDPTVKGVQNYPPHALIAPKQPHTVAVHLARLDMDTDVSRELLDAFESRAVCVTVSGTFTYVDSHTRYTLRVQCMVPFWSRSIPPAHSKLNDEDGEAVPLHQ
jgi:hypothetical protein